MGVEKNMNHNNNNNNISDDIISSEEQIVLCEGEEDINNDTNDDNNNTSVLDSSSRPKLFEKLNGLPTNFFKFTRAHSAIIEKNTKSFTNKNNLLIEELETDYLIIGAGASAMAFVDEMLTHGSKKNKFVICDMHSEPGGHWNDAYDFVTLHQPACTYGVSSDTSLGDGTGMTLHNLASKPEIMAYYIKIMKRWVDSGRVTWLPRTKCVWNAKEAGIVSEDDDNETEEEENKVDADEETKEEKDENNDVEEKSNNNNKKSRSPSFIDNHLKWRGSHQPKNMINRSMYLVPELAPRLRYHVTIKQKLVDCTYTGTEVPSTTKPRFKIAENLNFEPPNSLVKLKKHYERYCIIGAGKTGIDTVIYLLEMGIPADQLTWIIPNDMWMYPGEFLQKDSLMTKMRVWMHILSEKGLTNDERMLKLEKNGLAYRFDKHHMPKTHRHGTILLEEWDKIQLIEDKVRMGRVIEILKNGDMILENGVKSFSTDCNADEILFINCTAHGCTQKAIAPVWEDDKNLIRIQPIATCQILYSGGVIGFIEGFGLFRNDMAKKNELCVVVPNANTTDEFLDGWYQSIRNEINWAKANPILALYINGTRLNQMNNVTFYQKNVVGGLVIKDSFRYVRRWEKQHKDESGKVKSSLKTIIDTDKREAKVTEQLNEQVTKNSGSVQ